jgi:pre-mRNA-splicing factor 38A
MANVTDPLAAAVHGTDPQNLMEYITRQKIYDCRYWKEECFGLTAADILEKATQLTCIGGTYGGNSQPTKFVCLILKLLQISPPTELIDAFLDATEFKYVRALGAFYKRLTGRPADIYTSLEPLYTEYCKLCYRDVTEWKLWTMDQLIHQLLHNNRVCGIALPRLPSRRHLLDEGYLEAPYKSPILSVLGDRSLEEYLYLKVVDGSVPAKNLWESRLIARNNLNHKNKTNIDVVDDAIDDNMDKHASSKRTKLQNRKKSPYGTLFKSTASTPVPIQKVTDDYNNSNNNNNSNNSKRIRSSNTQESENPETVEEFSEAYWNQERQKLGLQPLRK